jgi:hypothetical protein
MTITRLLRAARRRADRSRTQDDRGVAMVATIGLIVFITALLVVGVLTTTTAIRSSRDHVSFEQSLAAAEAGVDTTLAAVSKAYAAGNPGWTNPSPCALPAPTSADVADQNAERTWARARLQALPSSCLVTTPQGQFVAGRAPGRQAVYAIGWSPSRADARAKSRLLKAEYVFAPYAPGKALLTDGNLDFSGSVAVSHVDPTATADVHTNKNIVGINNSLSVTGQVTATGTLAGCSSGVTGGCAAGKPSEAIPTMSPRIVWSTYAPYEPNWVDLCPAGVARKPQATSTAPCTGPVTSPGPWEYSLSSGVHTWTYPRTSSNVPGVYYVYQGNAVVGDSGNAKDDRQITVLAEAATTGGPASTCGKVGGNIYWKLFNLKPYLTGLVFLADGSVYGSANADVGPGLILAADKVDIKTSSSTIVGSIVAANTCAAAGPNEVQGVTIRYDQTIEAPVNDIIRTTLWLEDGG